MMWTGHRPLGISEENGNRFLQSINFKKIFKFRSIACRLMCHSGKPAKSKKSLRRRFFGGGGRSDCSADLRGLTLA